MKHTIAIIVSALLSASVEAQTNSTIYGLYLSELERRAAQPAPGIYFDVVSVTNHPAHSETGYATWKVNGVPTTNSFVVSNSLPVPVALALVNNGMFAELVTIGSVGVVTNTTQHSSAVGCPGYGKLGDIMVLPSNPPQYDYGSGHNHPPGAQCYPHVPATERWTVTEVVKSGVLRVFGESFPFRVVVSRTTNDHQRLSQEWKPANR